MPENIRCVSCGTKVLGITVSDPRPVDADECPNCGGTEFEEVT